MRPHRPGSCDRRSARDVRPRRGAASRHPPLAAPAVLQRGVGQRHPAGRASTRSTASTTSAAPRSAHRSSDWPRPILTAPSASACNLHLLGERRRRSKRASRSPTLSGPWTDSAGNSGQFAFGANTGGSPGLCRPLPRRFRARSRCSPMAASWRVAPSIPAPFPRPAAAPHDVAPEQSRIPGGERRWHCSRTTLTSAPTALRWAGTRWPTAAPQSRWVPTRLLVVATAPRWGRAR